jgi:ABC-type antimicrobial peptide transport system permease subunit
VGADGDPVVDCSPARRGVRPREAIHRFTTATAFRLKPEATNPILTIAGAATLLVTAAILGSLVPAARASRVDVLQALRSE